MALSPPGDDGVTKRSQVSCVAAALGNSKVQLDPSGRVIARFLKASRRPVDSGGHEVRAQSRTQQEMVNAHSRIARPAISQMAPESVGWRIGVMFPQGVAPSLAKESPVRGAHVGVQQRIVFP